MRQRDPLWLQRVDAYPHKGKKEITRELCGPITEGFFGVAMKVAPFVELFFRPSTALGFSSCSTPKRKAGLATTRTSPTCSSPFPL